MGEKQNLTKFHICTELNVDTRHFQIEDNLFSSYLPKEPSVLSFNFLKQYVQSRILSESKIQIDIGTSPFQIKLNYLPRINGSTFEDLSPGPIIRIKEYEPLCPYCQLFNKRTNVSKRNFFADHIKKISIELIQKKQESLKLKARYPKWHKRKDRFNYPNNKF